MKIFVIAAAALTLAGTVGATSAQAHPARGAHGHRTGWVDRDHRYGRDGYRGASYRNTWRDSLGRTCYRRSDGVRRCNADRNAGRHHAYRR